jgi:anthranilate phosphoribosyltransferase
MIHQYLKNIINGQNLSYEDSCDLAHCLMNQELNPLHVSALLSGMKVKGETYQEISGFARGLKDNAVQISPKSRDLYDIVGTGGDCANTFNISTTCAFVLAGAGLRIAKHGNRSISSKCGSADVLEALGVNIHLTPSQIEAQLDTFGLAFIFAPMAHPAMKNVMPIRKDLGIPTIFNIIGPLVNPLNLEGQYIGVFSPKLVDLMANSMVQLGLRKGLVVHGAGGIDELSLEGINVIAIIKGTSVEKIQIDPRQYNLKQASNEALKGGDSVVNAKITMAILNNEKGPHRDVVLLNSATALYAFGITESIEDGLLMAADSIDSGRAKEKLELLIKSNSLKGVTK